MKRITDNLHTELFVVKVESVSVVVISLMRISGAEGIIELRKQIRESRYMPMYGYLQSAGCIVDFTKLTANNCVLGEKYFFSDLNSGSEIPYVVCVVSQPSLEQWSENEFGFPLVSRHDDALSLMELARDEPIVEWVTPTISESPFENSNAVSVNIKMSELPTKIARLLVTSNNGVLSSKSDFGALISQLGEIWDRDLGVPVVLDFNDLLLAPDDAVRINFIPDLNLEINPCVSRVYKYFDGVQFWSSYEEACSTFSNRELRWSSPMNQKTSYKTLRPVVNVPLKSGWKQQRSRQYLSETA